jgi:ACT domain-containing protein
MPRLDKDTKEEIKKLSKAELAEIVLKMASKEKSVYNFILLNYLDKENASKELFDETMADLKKLE